MPDIDQSINSLVEPCSFKKSGINKHGSEDYHDWTETAWIDEWAGYPYIPCKVYRQSTRRNSPSTGGRCWPVPLSPLQKWYLQKPQKIKLSRDKSLRKAQIKLLRLAKEDWRKNRPTYTRPKRIPPGWKLVSIPDGTFELRKIGRNTFKRVDNYVWVPAGTLRLRPVNRKWTRGSKRVINAKVNDLLYYKQTAYSDGNAFFEVLDNPNGIVDSAGFTHGTTGATPKTVGWGYHFGSLVGFPFSDYGMSPPNDLSILSDPVDPVDYLSLYSNEIEEVSRLALSRHYTKLKNQKVDLATELSQAMLTINMIGDIAKRIGMSLLKLKKLDFVGAFAVLFPTSKKQVANDYLMWQYGIKPLLGDIQGAAEHLAEYISKNPPVKSNGHATKVFRFDEDEFPYPYRIRFTQHIEVKIRVKYGTVFEVPSALVQQAAQLGFTNSRNVLWELVPFSFVADWFLPIGDWLSNLSALDGLVVRESYKTVFIDEFRSTYVSQVRWEEASITGGNPAFSLAGTGGDSASGYLTLTSWSSFTDRQTVLCKREVITLPDVPLPRFKNPISKVHIANALALFTQLK